MLSMYVTKKQNDWDLWLPFCLFAYNTAKQDSTQESPYFLLYGRDPRLPIDVAFNAFRARTVPWTSDYAQYIALSLTEAHQIALHNIAKTQEQQKNQYDKRVYLKANQIGDMVYLWLPQLKRGQVPKLSSLWSGPHEILDIHLPRILLKNSDTHKQSWVHVNRIHSPKEIQAMVSCLFQEIPQTSAKMLEYLNKVTKTNQLKD